MSTSEQAISAAALTCCISHLFCPSHIRDRSALTLLLADEQETLETSTKSPNRKKRRREELEPLLRFLESSPIHCCSTQVAVHIHWLALCAAFGFESVHECTRRALYGNFSFADSHTRPQQRLRDSAEHGTRWMHVQPGTRSALGRLNPFPPYARSLQELAQWSADSGIFIHPDIEFVRDPSDYRDYRCFVKMENGGGEDDHDRENQQKRQGDRKYAVSTMPTLILDSTPLMIIPASCVIGFADPLNEAEKRDMMKGTATAAGVAIENTAVGGANNSNNNNNNNKANGGGESKEEPLSATEDACKCFFDSLSLIVNDLLVAVNNSSSDRRHVFARHLLSAGTRTLKNAPYLSDRDFAHVGQSIHIAEALRHMVHNFVDNGPLSGKVERPLLQCAVSLALSHSTVLPVRLSRAVDHMGELMRGLGTERLHNTDNDDVVRGGGGSGGGSDRSASCSDTDGGAGGIANGVGIIPWLHLLPHGGSNLNAVTLSFSAREAAAAAEWVAAQLPVSAATSPFMQRHLKKGFFVLVACKDIASGDEIRAQTMAPLNPVRVNAPPAADDPKRAKGARQLTPEEQEELRQRRLEAQYEADKEYDEMLAMWMVTTASAPSGGDGADADDDEPVSSAEAKFVQSCVADAVRAEIRQMLDEKRALARAMN